MNFTEEQRKAAQNKLSWYYDQLDALCDIVSEELEDELNLDPESVGKLLREEDNAT